MGFKKNKKIEESDAITKSENSMDRIQVALFFEDTSFNSPNFFPTTSYYRFFLDK